MHSSSKTPAAPSLLESPTQPLPKGKPRKVVQPIYSLRVHGRIPWADLIRFTFFEDLKTCTCGGVMTLIAAISCAPSKIITKIVQHLDIPVDISEPLLARLQSQLSLEWEEVEWVEHEDYSQDAEARNASSGPP